MTEKIGSHRAKPVARKARHHARLEAGMMAPMRRFVALSGEAVDLADGVSITHIQFRRFAGCPVCDLHLRSFAKRRSELDGVVREVVFFHSAPEKLAAYAADLPFAVIADPGKAVYRAFAVEASLRAVGDPRSWPMIARSVLAALSAMVRGRRPVPPLTPEGGRFGLPADFLISPRGEILACLYGSHAADHWTVNEVLAWAERLHDTIPEPISESL